LPLVRQIGPGKIDATNCLSMQEPT